MGTCVPSSICAMSGPCVNGCRFPRKSGGGEKAGTKYALWVGSRAGDSPAKRTLDAAHREQQSILVTKPLCDHGKQNWVDTNFRRHFSADLRRRQHLGRVGWPTIAPWPIRLVGSDWVRSGYRPERAFQCWCARAVWRSIPVLLHWPAIGWLRCGAFGRVFAL